MQVTHHGKCWHNVKMMQVWLCLSLGLGVGMRGIRGGWGGKSVYVCRGKEVSW